ncbi:MAG: aminoacyl-tRNA hydrolase [Patescibacteria group bacterium]|jgi:PTH1 family peptidyl-tRNA hydrolase
MTPYIIIGLGNPGKAYEKTRHNLGFRILDALAGQLDVEFKSKAKYSADIAEASVKGTKLILAKPQTFMNVSGTTAQALVQFYSAPPIQVWVVHDDVDIAFGKIKVQRDRSSAGHRGVQDIIERLGTQDFNRIRVGVDSRTEEQKKNIETDDYVLAKFTKDEEKKLDSLIPEIVERILKEVSRLPS